MFIHSGIGATHCLGKCFSTEVSFRWKSHWQSSIQQSRFYSKIFSLISLLFFTMMPIGDWLIPVLGHTRKTRTIGPKQYQILWYFLTNVNDNQNLGTTCRRCNNIKIIWFDFLYHPQVCPHPTVTCVITCWSFQVILLFPLTSINFVMQVQ